MCSRTGSEIRGSVGEAATGDETEEGSEGGTKAKWKTRDSNESVSN